MSTLHPPDVVCFSMSVFVSLFQGSEGFGAQVDKCLENAEYLYDQLQRRTDFKLVFTKKVSKAGFHGENLNHTVWHVQIIASS